MMGNLHVFLSSADCFRNNFFSKKFFQEHSESVKGSEPYQDSNCLHRLSKSHLATEGKSSLKELTIS